MSTGRLLLLLLIGAIVQQLCHAHNFSDPYELLAYADEQAETCANGNELRAVELKQWFYERYFGSDTEAKKFIPIENSLRTAMKSDPTGNSAKTYEAARRVMAAEIEKITKPVFCENRP